MTETLRGDAGTMPGSAVWGRFFGSALESLAYSFLLRVPFEFLSPVPGRQKIADCAEIAHVEAARTMPAHAKTRGETPLCN